MKVNKYYKQWNKCAVENKNKEYHIIGNGILGKKDYALLFENEAGKHHIPVETTEQLDFYGDVYIGSGVMKTLAEKNIRVAIHDRYGGLIGYFTPNGYTSDSKMIVNQCLEYSNDKKRLEVAKEMEKAAIHNIRSVLRYYIKSKGVRLENEVNTMTEAIEEIKGSHSVGDLLLIEARCRQQYYRAFNHILNTEVFYFEKRSKHPPEDPINALISFGNTVLYNRIQHIISKSQLDSRIGVIHAANRRNCSLNLDIADIFKPIIVDRVIFSLINRRQMTLEDFERVGNNAIYLSKGGKCVFIDYFEKKMATKITVEEISYSYEQLLEKEVRKYQEHIRTGMKYKAYRYY